jgi:polar amino acid transport system substrate-binding protein
MEKSVTAMVAANRIYPLILPPGTQSMQVNHLSRRITAAALWALAGIGSLHAQTLTGYTEQWPPYNYEEAGEVKGIASDVLRAICVDAKLICNLNLVPWARAYKIVSNAPNTVLFTTARKASREKEFLWVGPLLPRSTWVYVKTATDKAGSADRDMTQFRFGIVRDEAARQDLIQAGVPASSLVEDSSNATVLRLLLAEAVDAMVDTEVGMAWSLRSASLPPTAVTKFSKLSEDGGYYYALNLQTDPAVVHRMQASLDKLRRSGRLDAITRQYSSGL